MKDRCKVFFRAVKIITIVLVVLGLALYFISDIFRVKFYPSVLSENYSDDMDVVEFFIYAPKAGRTDLCIPEAYFRYSKDIRRGVKDGISLDLHYPSMKPWNVYVEEFKKEHPDYTSYSRKKRNEWKAERAYLRLRPGSGKTSVQQSWNRSFFGSEGGVSVENPDRFHQKKNGLWKLKGKGKYLSSLNDYYVSPVPGDYSTVLKCNGISSCTLETVVTNSMTLKFNFSQTELEHWRDLSDRISALAQSFICHKG